MILGAMVDAKGKSLDSEDFRHYKAYLKALSVLMAVKRAICDVQ